MSRTAVDFLNKCINLQTERGKEYNKPDVGRWIYRDDNRRVSCCEVKQTIL